MSELSRRHRRHVRRGRWETWRERYEIGLCVYRGVYSLVFGASLIAAAFKWTATEAGVQRTAQIVLGVSTVGTLVFVAALLLHRASVAERKRKQHAFERRFQERPAAHVRSVTRESNSPDVAP